MNSVGTKIKEMRIKNKLTQAELANGIVNRSYISQIEKGSVQPSLKLLKKLSDRLECDVECFFENIDKPFLKLNQKKVLSSLLYCVINKEYLLGQEYLIDLEEKLPEFQNSEKALFFYCKARLEEKHFKNLSTAIECYRKSIELYSSVRLINEKLRSINHLVNLYLEINQIEAAFFYLEEANNDSIYHQISGLEKISLLINLGVTHGKLGEYYSAIRYLKQALLISKNTNIYYNTGSAYMVLGLCQRRIHEYTNACESYKKALIFFEESCDNLNLAGTYINLGIIFRIQNNTNESLDFLEKSLLIYHQIKDIKGVINSQYEMAINYALIGEFNKVYDLYYEMLNYNLEEGRNAGEILLKFKLLAADCFIKQSLFNKGITLYKIIINEVGDYPNLKKKAYLKLSDAYNKMGKKDKVIDSWLSFIEMELY